MRPKFNRPYRKLLLSWNMMIFWGLKTSFELYKNCERIWPEREPRLFFYPLGRQISLILSYRDNNYDSFQQLMASFWHWVQQVWKQQQMMATAEMLFFDHTGGSKSKKENSVRRSQFTATASFRNSDLWADLTLMQIFCILGDLLGRLWLQNKRFINLPVPQYSTAKNRNLDLWPHWCNVICYCFAKL